MKLYEIFNTTNKVIWTTSTKTKDEDESLDHSNTFKGYYGVTKVNDVSYILKIEEYSYDPLNIIGVNLSFGVLIDGIYIEDLLKTNKFNVQVISTIKNAFESKLKTVINKYDFITVLAENNIQSRMSLYNKLLIGVNKILNWKLFKDIITDSDCLISALLDTSNKSKLEIDDIESYLAKTTSDKLIRKKLEDERLAKEKLEKEKNDSN